MKVSKQLPQSTASNKKIIKIAPPSTLVVRIGTKRPLWWWELVLKLISQQWLDLESRSRCLNDHLNQLLQMRLSKWHHQPPWWRELVLKLIYQQWVDLESRSGCLNNHLIQLLQMSLSKWCHYQPWWWELVLNWCKITQLFYAQKIFGPKTFFNQIFLDQKFYRPKSFLDAKNFHTQKKLQTKIFSDPNFFRPIFFGWKNSLSLIPKINV